MQYFGSNSRMTRASVISILSCEEFPRYYWKPLVWGFCLKPDSLDFRKWEERGGCFDLSNYHHLAGPSLASVLINQLQSPTNPVSTDLSRVSLSSCHLSLSHTRLKKFPSEQDPTCLPEMRNPIQWRRLVLFKMITTCFSVSNPAGSFWQEIWDDPVQPPTVTSCRPDLADHWDFYWTVWRWYYQHPPILQPVTPSSSLLLAAGQEYVWIIDIKTRSFKGWNLLWRYLCLQGKDEINFVSKISVRGNNFKTENQLLMMDCGGSQALNCQVRRLFLSLFR